MPPTDRLIDRLAERRTVRLWTRAADAAAAADLAVLKAMRGRARRARAELDRLLAVAETRLALPMLGSNAMHRPLGADWLWRPSPWREPLAPRGRAGLDRRTELGPGAALFHDCPLAETAYRQERNARPGDLAPFGLAIEVLGFRGSFLSLALDLPPGAVEGLTRRHVFGLELDFEADRAVGGFARLNVKHGPNTEQMVAQIGGGGGATAEFDLATVRLNERRVEKLWLDLIFQDPAYSRFALRDLVMSRRRRAEM
jgi:hypothetical protein